jgi:hypothetical protein
MGLLSWFGLGKKKQEVLSKPAAKKPTREWLKVTARFKIANKIAWGDKSFYPIDDIGNFVSPTGKILAKRAIKNKLPIAKHELLEWEALAAEVSGKVKQSINNSIVKNLKTIFRDYEYFQHQVLNYGMATARKTGRGDIKLTHSKTDSASKVRARLQNTQKLYKEYRDLVKKQYERRIKRLS